MVATSVGGKTDMNGRLKKILLFISSRQCGTRFYNGIIPKYPNNISLNILVDKDNYRSWEKTFRLYLDTGEIS